MRAHRRRLTLVCLALLWLVAEISARAADETSVGDKLRILYSHRFSFDDRGIPVLTVAIATGRDSVIIQSPPGQGAPVLLPGGIGGAEIRAGDSIRITVEDGVPGRVGERLVVAHLGPKNQTAVADALATWRRRGFSPRAETVGAVFGISGQVIDTRETLVTLEPLSDVAALSRRYGIKVGVHRTLVRRPRGTIVAQSGATVVRNPSVLWLRPASDKGTLTVAGIDIGGGGATEARKSASRRYHGSLYVTVGTDGKLAVVNAVASDQLLDGLVPAEMYPSADPAALAAQAIAARTNLLAKLGHRHTADPFLLCASQHCQVYAGAGRETAATNRAVSATRGQVLVGPGGALIDARYCAACGGHTESNAEVWPEPPDPVLQGRFDAPGGTFAPVAPDSVARFLATGGDDAYCARSPLAPGRFRWTAKVKAAAIAKRLLARGIDVGHIISLEARRRGVSGRITDLAIHGDGGDTRIRGELSIRRTLGGLKSSLFVARPIREGGRVIGFSLRGGGFGHGVGMCQLGAMAMARAGLNTAKILANYYHRATVTRLY